MLAIYSSHHQVPGQRVNRQNAVYIPLLTTENQTKQDACASACAYIVENLMTELEQLSIIAGQWNNKPKDKKPVDNGSNNGVDDIPDPNKSIEILEGEPSAIKDDVPFNMDKEISDKYPSGLEEEDTIFSLCKNKGQLEGPLRKIQKRDIVLSTYATRVENVKRTQKKELQLQAKYTPKSAWKMLWSSQMKKDSTHLHWATSKQKLTEKQ